MIGRRGVARLVLGVTWNWRGGGGPARAFRAPSPTPASLGSHNFRASSKQLVSSSPVRKLHAGDAGRRRECSRCARPLARPPVGSLAKRAQNTRAHLRARARRRSCFVINAADRPARGRERAAGRRLGFISRPHKLALKVDRLRWNELAPDANQPRRRQKATLKIVSRLRRQLINVALARRLRISPAAELTRPPAPPLGLAWPMGPLARHVCCRGNAGGRAICRPKMAPSIGAKHPSRGSNLASDLQCGPN